jgi:hypothetical protein
MSGAGERYLVMIPVEGRLRPPLPVPTLRILPVLWGASTLKGRGIVITSEIKNFERLLQLIVSYMAQEAGQAVPAIETFVEEHVVMPAGQLVIDREGALTRLARAAENEVDPYGVALPESDLDLPWRKILSRQALIAAAPALMLLIDGMQRHAEKATTWGAFAWGLALLVVGIAELPFAAKLVQAIGDLLVGSGKFKKSIWAYLELQWPRVVLVVLSLALLSIGTPPFLALLPWLAGIVATTVLTTRFVRKLYFIPTGQALFAATGIFMYQVAMFVFYVGVR